MTSHLIWPYTDIVKTIKYFWQMTMLVCVKHKMKDSIKSLNRTISVRIIINCVCNTSLMHRVRHQNPDKSNNFSKRNFINERIKYYKKFFYISRSRSLQSIIIQYSPSASITTSILDLKRSHAHCSVMSISVNAASIAVLNDVTLR